MLVLCCLGVNVALAETVYVTDVLRLRLQAEPTDASAVVTTMGSGDRLELVEKAGFYALVKTEDGQEGWAKATYLVSEKPARAQLAETQAELEKLRASTAPAQQQLRELRAKVDSLTEESAALHLEADAREKRLAELEAQNQEYAERLSIGGWRVPWRWAAGAMAVALLGGLFAGTWWFDYRSRKRHGGFRIY